MILDVLDDIPRRPIRVLQIRWLAVLAFDVRTDSIHKGSVRRDIVQVVQVAIIGQIIGSRQRRSVPVDPMGINEGPVGIRPQVDFIAGRIALAGRVGVFHALQDLAARPVAGRIEGQLADAGLRRGGSVHDRFGLGPHALVGHRPVPVGAGVGVEDRAASVRVLQGFAVDRHDQPPQHAGALEPGVRVLGDIDAIEAIRTGSVFGDPERSLTKGQAPARVAAFVRWGTAKKEQAATGLRIGTVEVIVADRGPQIACAVQLHGC